MAPRSHLTPRKLARTTTYWALGATILVGLAAASCDSREPRNPVEPGPPVPTLVRLELRVPKSIAPGESAQLTVNAVRSDNSVENVSGQARWDSSNRNILEISSTGVATGVARGEAVIFVAHQTQKASAPTFVLPAGTYRLDGTITDSGVRLPGVSVAVIEGVGENLTTTTEANGKYALYGVSGRVRLLAKASGYLDQIQAIDVTDHRAFDFEMRVGQRTDVRGQYRLTIDRPSPSHPSCAGPEVPQTRSYDATVEQDGPHLTVRLSDADFIITGGRGNAFTGAIDGSDRVTFFLGEQDWYYYPELVQDLVERMSATQSLVINGTVTAGLTPSGISGTMGGAFLLAEGTAGGPPSRYTRVCHGIHRFEMVRR